MILSQNQSALILDASDDGEITVNAASENMDSLTGSLCQAIASKLMQDEGFQKELMAMIGD